MLRKYLENTPTDPQRLQSNLETILWYSLKCRKKNNRKYKPKSYKDKEREKKQFYQNV